MKICRQLSASFTFAAILFIAASSHSAITTLPFTTTINPLDSFVIPIRVQTTGGEEISAISGQLNYNSSQFYGARVSLGPGITDWKSVGHVVRPGFFRFVLYRDPIGTLPTNTSAPTFHIHMTNAPYIIYGARAEFTFVNVVSAGDVDRAGKSSASNELGELYPEVAFGTITVNINQSSADQNWLLYE